MLFKGDSLTSHRGRMFSTRDQDNDVNRGNCAYLNKGGWWFTSCYSCHLNGRFYNSSSVWNFDCIIWMQWKIYSLTFTEMKIKPFL